VGATLHLEGQTFYRLKVISLARKGRERAWLCQCECGNFTTVITEHLMRGGVRSCGCFKLERVTNLKLNHGHARAGKWSSEFRAWCSAKNRCYNPKYHGYHRYGGRGIVMADEWRSDFAAFLNHIGPKPDPRLSLDRVDVNGNYEPGNVRWTTPSEQRLNQRRMRAA
jgi:hypothetical protein